MTGQPIEQLYQAITAEHPERDFLVISHSISRELHYALTTKLAEKKNKKLTLFLTTFGGDPHGGYRIARCLRHHYSHIRLVVPSFCKSAGTLIAIAADELVIGDLGELGPLDIQVSNPNEMSERSSGLDIMQSLQIIQQHAIESFRKNLFDIRQGARLSTKLAGAFAAEIAVGAVAPLYAQVDPNRLGEMQRAMRITKEYGSRLDEYTTNLRNNALNTLVAHYPSHAFVIDRKEAGRLFKRVLHPTETEKELAQAFSTILATETSFKPEFFTLESEASQGEKHDRPASEAPQGAPRPAKRPQRRRAPAPTNGRGV